ncbi:uncharacterized protein LOC126382137 [Pectinophora gossypiella]|uniref:uncharacterized protein LOC126382137 n=1 Tax=Pectinophora gossypiella TaxID=13191 RepID=UPI00214F0F5A|nr:uncharacterized protein LOC126382137 [Pectinophora gossypiella]XP_049887862.1 uncharacterized protein LOC126382137 [Pectinophora gossypiella]
MKMFTLILAACLGLATTLPVDNVSDNTGVAGVATRNSFFEQLFLEILEDLRETMVTGSEDIPVLDPLQIEHLHLDLDDLGLENAHITLDNVEARKLSTFVVDNLSITATSIILQRYAIELDLYIPVIEVDSEGYDLFVNVMGGNIFGTGDAKLRIIEPRIVASLEAGLSISGGISINIRSARVFFTLGAFRPEINGMFGNPMVDDFVNSFLGHLIEDLVNSFQDEISDFLSGLVMEVGNDIIGGILPGLIAHDEELTRKVQLLQASEPHGLTLGSD